ncbi:MAG: hypothetical protein WC917_00530 [Bacilli bacterium]|jgi:hypothetical protein
MFIYEVFPLLKEGMFVKIVYKTDYHISHEFIIGEIIDKQKDRFYVASNIETTGYNKKTYLAIERGYKSCFLLHDDSESIIEILDKLPEEHKPKKPSLSKGRVIDVFDKLKPGMFVKTRADSVFQTEHDVDIIGEIGLIGSDNLYILTNNVGNATGHDTLEEFSHLQGYKYAWSVHKENINMIEVLNELPKENPTLWGFKKLDHEQEEDFAKENKCDECDKIEECLRRELKRVNSLIRI